MKVMKHTIHLKSINEIRGNKLFYIPSYQRGYRWDPQQVLNLLEDVYEFIQNRESEFYCLQPLVVRKNDQNHGFDVCYEVVDGQQRLTTIFLILKYLNKPSYNINYESRKDSQEYLNNIHLNTDEKNIDFHFFKQAFKTIQEWFEVKHKNNFTLPDEFHIALGKDVKVIWYELDEKAHVRDIFTRLNVGKIPLTNAELIKALFLSFANIKGDDELSRLKQLEIATEWDLMEKKLQNDAFWYFVGSKKKYINRIELLFDLVAKNTKRTHHDKFHTFYYFQSEYANANQKLSLLWNQVKLYLFMLEEWYKDRMLYHHIGFLMTQNMDITDIIELYQDKEIFSKSVFRESVKKKVRQMVAHIKLDELHYYENPKEVHTILLLFNVVETLSQRNSETRFPFDSYVKNKWSIEHIHAQQIEGLRSKEQWRAWINDTLQSFRYIGREKYNNIIMKLEKLVTSVDITEQDMEGVFQLALSTMKEEYGTDLHTLDNLTLLDQATNSALGNNFFDVKRRKLIAREKEGYFVPLCTRNVFMKYYSNNAKDVYLWGEEDRANYMDAIKIALQPYLLNGRN